MVSVCVCVCCCVYFPVLDTFKIEDLTICVFGKCECKSEKNGTRNTKPNFIPKIQIKLKIQKYYFNNARLLILTIEHRKTSAARQPNQIQH